MSSLYLPHQSEVIFPSWRGSKLIYWTIIIMLVSCICVLPIIEVDVGIRSPGIIRPASERTVVRSVISGIIDELYYNEGSYVEKDSVIFTIRDNLTSPKLEHVDFDLHQKQQILNDLKLVTSYIKSPGAELPFLTTEIYRGQFSRYQFHLKDLSASLAKAASELASDSILFVDNIIAPREYYNKLVEWQKLAAGLKAFESEQFSLWQQQLLQASWNLSELRSMKAQVLGERLLYQVRAPVSGFLQGISSHYKGAMVQAGEIFCELSPETSLIAECYVPTRDIGYLVKDQPVNFQVDAFDYNYFGIIKGRIASIDNDFTILNDIPVYKVRCKFDKSLLSLNNGYTGRLKKRPEVTGPVYRHP